MTQVTVKIKSRIETKMVFVKPNQNKETAIANALDNAYARIGRYEIITIN